ncbi:hypothetical protein BDW66DRAFT_138073 [Aspergillus desertorum]
MLLCVSALSLIILRMSIINFALVSSVCVLITDKVKGAEQSWRSLFFKSLGRFHARDSPLNLSDLLQLPSVGALTRYRSPISPIPLPLFFSWIACFI